jgi:hypothetical protein
MTLRRALLTAAAVGLAGAGAASAKVITYEFTAGLVDVQPAIDVVDFEDDGTPILGEFYSEYFGNDVGAEYAGRIAVDIGDATPPYDLAGVAGDFLLRCSLDGISCTGEFETVETLASGATRITTDDPFSDDNEYVFTFPADASFGLLSYYEIILPACSDPACEDYRAEFALFDVSTTIAPIPVPASAVLLASALAVRFARRRMVRRA